MIIMHVPKCWVYSSRWWRRGPWRPDAYRNAEMRQRMWLGARGVCETPPPTWSTCGPRDLGKRGASPFLASFSPSWTSALALSS